ncbi:DUF3048 domain-containing protein [Halobacillus sp. Marseille-Q1614]|uniref:DUF3048 domain-containing protein n=1 Tax=Halobacillus sp. Marseille-Q1614 TaxID=2709134 RepID=UPI001570B3CD|nr:DUF3048 domain-containing protein [Halobacillus sp. Marseille-Q1614]
MKKSGILFLSILIVLLTACNKQGESKTDDGREEVSGSEYVYPLTGESSKEPVDQRVIAVMVNNHTNARPQSGLSQADVVYEVLAEGQITRFLALFQSSLPETIGPVRSARPYYMDIAKGFDALYTYHGAAGFINQQVRESGIDYVDGAKYDNDGMLFKRTTDRKAPHNSYLLVNGIDPLIQSKGYQMEKNIEPLPFSEETDIKGKAAEKVTITYGKNEIVQYEFDSDRKQYLRFSDGEPSIDQETNQQISLDNVLIVHASHDVIDEEGRRDIDLSSGGEGYLLQNGRQFDVEWKNTKGRILPYRDGKPVSFSKGQTWVNIIPDDPGIVTTE